MEAQSNTTHRATRSIRMLAAAVVLLIVAIGYFFLSPRAAPEVTFISLSGEKITTKSLRGKVVVVNFWATSCTACVREMPQMIATYDKYRRQGLELVAVAMSYDPPNYVLDYAQTRRLPFKVALDVRGDLAKSFGDVAMTPTTFVIGKDGNIIERYVGAPEFAALHQLLEQALAT